MAKDKIAYVCNNCGQESTKWIGKCPNCGQWNTFKEIRIASDTGTAAARNAARTIRAGESVVFAAGKNVAQRLRDVLSKENRGPICAMPS